MNFQVLPLKVLVSKQVVKWKMDYSTFLNGTAKEELDRLDRLAGNFRIEDSKVTIEGCDWQDLKKIMPEWVINLLQRKTDLSIVEKMKNGTRTWITKSSNGKDVDLMSNKGNFKDDPHHWSHHEAFIEDGRLVNFTMVSKMEKGERIFCFYYYQSFAINQQGKLVKRLICRKPHLGITVTKDILAVRKEAQDNHGVVDSTESEEGDAHINATLASLREAVRNGLLNDAIKRKMK